MTAQIVCLAAFRSSKNKLHPQAMSPASPLVSTVDEPPGSQRGELRHLVNGLNAQSITIAGQPATLQNVSRNGMMAATGLQAHCGTRVLVTIAGCSALSARVIWKGNGSVGLELPMHAMRLQAL